MILFHADGRPICKGMMSGMVQPYLGLRQDGWKIKMNWVQQTAMELQVGYMKIRIGPDQSIQRLLMGLPVILDSTIPVDEIHLWDQYKIIAAVTNLAIPSWYDSEPFSTPLPTPYRRIKL